MKWRMRANLLGLGSNMKTKRFFYFLKMFCNQFSDFVDPDPHRWLFVYRIQINVFSNRRLYYSTYPANHCRVFLTWLVGNRINRIRIQQICAHSVQPWLNNLLTYLAEYTTWYRISNPVEIKQGYWIWYPAG